LNNPAAVQAVPPSAALKALKLPCQLACKAALREFLDDRINGGRGLGGVATDDYIMWSLTTKMHHKIVGYLQKSGLTLSALSPTETGVVLINRQRIDHVIQERQFKDQVGTGAVLELFQQLFVEDGAAVALNQSGGAGKGAYSNQFVLFRDTYKSKTKEVSGQSPAAVLSLQTTGHAVLTIETAYWIQEHKAKALRKEAL
jgi:hypothetical protein